MQPAENPFASPRAGAAHTLRDAGPRRVLRWRIIPVVLLGALGLLIATLGLVLFGIAVVWSVEGLQAPGAAKRPGELLVVTLFALALTLVPIGTGALWIWSAVLFWRQRWRGAVVTSLLGAVPVGLFFAMPLILEAG